MSFFTVKEIKACRKPCLCHWCGERISKGDSKTTTATVWEGDFHFTNFHPECYLALKEWQKLAEFGEEWPDYGTMKRGSTEEN